MVFGKAEQTDDYTGEGYGMIGQSGSGMLKVKQKDNQKLKNHLSKRTQQRLKKPSSGATSGLSSSIVFTPVQGMELVNPNAQADRARDSTEKYFSATGSFNRVGKTGSSSTIPNSSNSLSLGKGTFAIPAPKLKSGIKKEDAKQRVSNATMMAPPSKRKKTLDSATAHNELRE